MMGRSNALAGTALLRPHTPQTVFFTDVQVSRTFFEPALP
jgi:hypothetical protein